MNDYYPTASGYNRFCDDFLGETGHYYNGEPITAADAFALMQKMRAEEKQAIADRRERQARAAKIALVEQARLKAERAWQLYNHEKPRSRFHLMVAT